jgi:hypothetical protein
MERKEIIAGSTNPEMLLTLVNEILCPPGSKKWSKIVLVDSRLPFIPAWDPKLGNSEYLTPEESEYVKDCSNLGIMPFSKLEFYCTGGFPQLRATEVADMHEYRKKERVIQGLLGGGRFHFLDVGIWDETGKTNAFSKFKNNFLVKLLDNGYQIHSGELVYVSYEIDGEYSPNTMVDLSVEFGPNSVVLCDHGREKDKPMRQMLANYLSELKQRNK